MPPIRTYSNTAFAAALVTTSPFVVAAYIIFYAPQVMNLEYSRPAAISNMLQNVIVSVSPQKMVGEASSVTGQPTQTAEMHIADNGLVLLRGAHVDSIAEGTITASMKLGAGSFVWTVKTDAKTKVTLKTGENGKLSDIQAGDTVIVTGMLGADASQPVINAWYIRSM